MKKKTLIISEITGFFVVTAGVLLLWNIYELTGRSTIGIVFGAVNSSVWERTKCISICFMLCGLCELLCVRPCFRIFVVAKTLGLCASLSSFIIAESFFGADTSAEFFALCASVLFGVACSYLLTVNSVNLRQFFAPACFLLMLIFMMTFSFTAFSPRLRLFRDPYTGCYGVIPQSFDLGAVYLG